MYKECSAGEMASSHKQFMVEEQQISEEALKWRMRVEYHYAANVSSRAGPKVGNADRQCSENAKIMLANAGS